MNNRTKAMFFCKQLLCWCKCGMYAVQRKSRPRMGRAGKCACGGYFDWRCILGGSIMAKLLTEEEYNALLADAERYRWLRIGDNDEKVMEVYPGHEEDNFSHFLLRQIELDMAIDKAHGIK